MFTLSGILLEDRENLFQDFWSLFSIFLFVFPRLVLKKEHQPNGPCPTRTPPGRVYKARPEAHEAASPARNPSAARRRAAPPRSRRPAPPRPRRPAAADHARRRRSPRR